MAAKTDYWVAESIKDVPFVDRYEMGDELGRGASAIVYSCRNKKDNTQWAVKKITKRPHSRVVTVEIKVLLGLSHPNVVRMKEVFETTTSLHLVLEYAIGGELFDRIVERGSYSEKDAANVFRQILTGIEYLHQNSIIHRDLKPENLLYCTKDEDSVLKIADFGLSKIMTTSTLSMSMCGTPSYCAPEVLQGSMYSFPADIWSAGVILFILLVGYEPFFASNDHKIYKRIIRIDWKFESPWWDDISSNSKDLISKILIRDANKRPNPTEALQHPWVTGEAAKDENMVKTKQRLISFNGRRKLKAAAKAVIMTNRVMKFAGRTTS
ncbi:calcium/calmodulin-dependent protein kinase type IV [Octopus bimaculoides]|uniref:Protein kinase domain-containing protein n=1 Tax=Octopus bimaculoides TaxID=37653 RepID=A0A0L8HIV5_OCTBM|nr:calcium/calmodulin-dependent protein kinase type IV [Octopus bimaculoides]|eukprot:XP_014771973.1 PREDICTED: calcium/calmodulin-dependent protein kinase type IV-like [Octopus bimaculoides]